MTINPTKKGTIMDQKLSIHRDKINENNMPQIITLYQFHVPPKMIAQTLNLKYSAVITAIRTIKAIHKQITPGQMSHFIQIMRDNYNQYYQGEDVNSYDNDDNQGDFI
jgi:hypothetical protein